MALCGTALNRNVIVLVTWMESVGVAWPATFVGLFLAASVALIWRLQSLASQGWEGTALGTLVMPYFSGLGNLVFVYVMGRKGGSGSEVMINSLVNNVTSLTLLIGLPALIWGMGVVPRGKVKKAELAQSRLDRLSLLMTLGAVMFFSGIVWALAYDGDLDFGDGLVLIALFLFWQCFQVFDVLKGNVRNNRSFSWLWVLDLVLILICAWLVYISIDWLVAWMQGIESGFFSAAHLGWISGWLMVVPNAMLAFYYGWKKQSDIVYSSQVGDAHVCIPLCLGVYALFQDIVVPPFFDMGIALLAGTALLHGLTLLTLGRLPRWMGWLLVAAYGWFVYQGLDLSPGENEFDLLNGDF